MANLNFLMGYPSRVEQLQRFTPGQQAGLNQLLSQGLANVGPEAIEQRARKQFNTQTIPSLAERFTAMGGGQRSSAFQGALGQAGSDLESQLAALRSQYGLQQLGFGLQPQFENLYVPEKQGLLEAAAPGAAKYALQEGPGILSNLSSILGKAAPVAGAAGSTLGNVLGGIGGAAGSTAGALGAGGALAGLGPLGLLLAALAGGYGLYNYLDK